MKHCKNCNKPVHDLYCSHCGQKTNFERITLAYIGHELFHFFTHLEKGFLFTTVQMLIRPGRTAKNFIDGKRKNYQSPVSYFLVWTTIYILLLYLVEKFFGENVVINYKEYFGPGSTTKLAISHLSIVLTIVIPFQALYLFLLVTRNTYNYFETMVATIYSLGTIIFLQFIFVIGAIIIHSIITRSIALKVSDSFKVGYLLWFIADTVKLYPVKLKSLRVIAFIILAFGTFTIWRLFAFPELMKVFSASH